MAPVGPSFLSHADCLGNIFFCETFAESKGAGSDIFVVVTQICADILILGIAFKETGIYQALNCRGSTAAFYLDFHFLGQLAVSPQLNR